MLFFRRSHALLGTDAGRGVATLRCPDLRVYVAWMSGGLRFDSSVMGLSPAAASIGEGAISIQLGGELGVRSGGREVLLGEGDAAAMRVRAWDERWEGPFRALVVEWTDPEVRALPDFDRGRIGSADRAAAAAVAERLESGALVGEAAAHAVADLLARLSAAGFPTPRRTARDLAAGLPPGAQAVADALGRTVSGLSGAPQVDDVAARLGVSARQVRRRIEGLGPWLPGFSKPEGWRRQLRIIRATLAASFLTRRDVSLEQVASSLGYGSARALLLALAQEGLPAPRVLRGL